MGAARIIHPQVFVGVRSIDPAFGFEEGIAQRQRGVVGQFSGGVVQSNSVQDSTSFAGQSEFGSGRIVDGDGHLRVGQFQPVLRDGKTPRFGLVQI